MHRYHKKRLFFGYFMRAVGTSPHKEVRIVV